MPRTHVPISSVVESGHAKLLPETVVVELLSIKGLIDTKGQRISAQTRTSDCKNGVGTLKLDSGAQAEYIPNVVASQSTPWDTLFRQLCEAGMPIYRQQEEDWNRSVVEGEKAIGDPGDYIGNLASDCSTNPASPR